MKNIIITGAAQGIGQAITETLLRQDMKLFLIDKQETAFIREVVGERAVFFLQDIADRQGLSGVLRQLAEEEFDAIINNAGEVYLEKWDELNLSTWDRTLAVNVTAPLQIVHELRASLRSGASIVNIASTDGMVAAFDTVAYAASKAALMNLTKSLAVNLGPRGIRVNAVAPGWVETEMTQDTMPDESVYMTPLGRNASAQEIADVVEFLVSEKSSFISGETLTVDGGLMTTDYPLKAEANQ